MTRRASGAALLLGAIVVALAWLIPNHYPPWTSFYNDNCMALGLVLIAAGIGLQREGPGMPRLAWAILAVAAIPWLQWASGLLKFSGDAWISTLYLFGFASAVTVGFRWARIDAKSLASALSTAALGAALVSSVLAMMQVFGVWSLGMWVAEIPDGMRAAANLSQSNNLATLLGFGALALLLLYEQRRIGQVTAGALFLLLAVGLSLTQSRMSLLLGPVVWVGLWLAVRRGVEFRTRLSTVALAIGLYWFLMWAEPFAVRSSLLASFQSVEARGIESLRFKIWPMLFDGLSLHPWKGYGWLQVAAAELAVADRYPPTGELWAHAHNLFFELVIWCGYPLGLLLDGGIVYWFFTRLLRVASVEAVVGMLVVGVAGVHAMFELPYHYAYFLIPVGLWMGQVEASLGSPAFLSSKWHFATLFASMAMLGAIWWNYAAVEEDFRLVRFENLKVGSLRAAQPAPDAPFLSSLTAFLRFSRTVPSAGMSSAELERMGAVVDRYPYAAGMARYASALALNGRPDEARLMYTKILHIHGEAIYVKVKHSLHEAAADGPESLRALERSVP